MSILFGSKQASTHTIPYWRKSGIRRAGIVSAPTTDRRESSRRGGCVSWGSNVCALGHKCFLARRNPETFDFTRFDDSLLLHCCSFFQPHHMICHASNDHHDDIQPPCPPLYIFSVYASWPLSLHSEPLIRETDGNRLSALVTSLPRSTSTTATIAQKSTDAVESIEVFPHLTAWWRGLIQARGGGMTVLLISKVW